MPELERMVGAAGKIQSELDKTNQLFTTEIAALKSKLANKEAAFVTTVHILKSSPYYIEPLKLDKKVKDLKELACFLEAVSIANKKEDVTKGNEKKDITKDLEEDSFPSCPICLTLPMAHILGCQQCDAMFCKGCAGELKKCAICRQNLTEKPLARNKIAEKLVASIRG